MQQPIHTTHVGLQGSCLAACFCLGAHAELGGILWHLPAHRWRALGEFRAQLGFPSIAFLGACFFLHMSRKAWMAMAVYARILQ